MISQSQNFNIKAFNTFGINAVCDYWIDFTQASDLPGIFASLPAPNFRCIGQGSNLLFVNDYHGCLLHSSILDMDVCHLDGGVEMRLGSGLCLDSIVEKCCQAQLWGIENLSGIPGDIGAAAVQNVGAYGVELKDVVTKVEAYDTVTSKFVEFTNADCQYGYRHSIFKQSENIGRYIITFVTIRLSSDGTPRIEYGNLGRQLAHISPITPSAVREVVIATRNSKLPDPQQVGSVGSFFKNPVVPVSEYERLSQMFPEENVPHYPHGSDVKIPAAWLIEKCGWKGKTMGNAGVWHLQPLVLVNATGDASGAEIEQLELAIVRDVNSRFGIQLHPEADHIY